MGEARKDVLRLDFDRRLTDSNGKTDPIDGQSDFDQMQYLGIIRCVVCRSTIHEVKWEIPDSVFTIE